MNTIAEIRAEHSRDMIEILGIQRDIRTMQADIRQTINRLENFRGVGGK